MLVEALKWLEQHVNRQPEFIDKVGNQLVYMTAEGNKVGVKLAGEPRYSECFNLESLAAFQDEGMECWFNGDGVSLRRVRAMDGVYLQPTPVWYMDTDQGVAYGFLENGDWLKHKQIVHSLRTRCLPEIRGSSCPDLVDRLRLVKFSEKTEADSEVTKGGEKMGRSVSREATGADELPEFVAITMRRWEAFEILVTIEFHLQVDFEGQRIRLCPSESSMADARRHSMGKLQDLIQSHVTKCPVFQGTF